MKNRKAARIFSVLLCLAMLLTLPVSAESVDGTYAELKYGMRDSDEVRAMQTRLRELGYMSAYPSGGYFDDTAKAVADFQAASGFRTNKKTASPEMLALLFSDKAIAKNGTVTPADTPAPTVDPTARPAQTDAPASSYSKLTYGTRSSSAVRAMQDRLRELGYMSCDSTGGYWGETAKAVADFQAAAGLKVDKNTASAEMQQLLFSDKAPAKGGNTPAPTATPTPAPTEPDAPVEPTTVPSAYTELRANTSSEAIRAMQARLKALGYLMANPSGGYYSATISAVEAFQKAAGLKVQGKVATVEMQRLLFSSSAPSAYAGAAQYADLKYGMDDSDQVRLMQRRLNNLGYFSGTATGNYYSATQRAVAKFMTAIGMSGDGKTASAAMLKILYTAGAPANGEKYNPDPTEAPTATPVPDATTPVPSESPTPSPTPVVYGELKYGVSGDEAVRCMQDRLRDLGYMSCASTGGYYTQTRRAVEAFLEACYMSGDGRTACVEMQQLLFSDRAPKYGDKLITASPSPDVTPDPTASTAPTLPPADSYTALTYGMSKNDAVMAAQTRLKELGFMSCAPTGNYYSLTVDAAKAFQKYAYLPVDGKVISVEMQQILFYTGDLAKLIEERKNAQSDYSKARTDITMKVGSTGEQVVYMTRRLKELGYLTGSETDVYSSSVAEAVRWFQNSNALSADGIAGSATLTKLYSDKALDASGSMTGNDDKPVKVEGTPVKPALSAVKNVDFFSSEGDKYFNRKKGTFRDGAYAIVTDVATGISYRVKRVGGYNHTDVEPATAFDTWQMYRIYGEEWAWTRHAVLVTLSDGTTLAGSANGMPHGGSHVDGNNMNGHTCIHFLNSRTHGSDKVDAAHQSAIRTAANCSVSSVQSKVNAQ